MKKCVYGAIALAIAASSFLFAQNAEPPRTPPTPAEMVAHQVEKLTTLLTLTAAQQAQATAIYTNELTAESSLRGSLKTAHSALQTAIQNNDVASITTQAAQIGNLTAQELESHSKAEAAFYALLTPEQQAKFKELRPIGPGGPGGPKGFGPGPGHP